MNLFARFLAAGLLLLIGVRCGIYGVRALATGIAIANGRREYSQKKAPMMFWCAVVVQLALAVAAGMALVVTFTRHSL